jgi:ppGpp synthetase/RelA/SpoT-type nucleotidyltranferase
VDIVNDFINVYRQQFDFFQEVSKICAQQCEIGLESLGIKAIVTYRAKRPDRLEEKLRKRSTEGHNYVSRDDIYSDIVDLAGIRIALYFPADQIGVGKFINSQFELTRPPKTFPEPNVVQPIPIKRFSGYWATHYIVKLKRNTLPTNQQRYAETCIEIQVASVLMHAWAEVEHDLLYKPAHGKLSEDEYAILDELNGLVMAGEIALERLQKAGETRVGGKSRKLNDHYELSSYLLESLRDTLPKLPKEISLGRVDLLFKLLVQAGIDRPNKIDPIIKNIRKVTQQRPIAEQITDAILASNPDLYPVYEQIRAEQDEREPYHVATEKIRSDADEKALGFFLSKWILLEKTLGLLAKIKKPRTYTYRIMSPVFLKELGLFDKNTLYKIDRFRNIRNNLVHGKETLTAESLKQEGEALASLIGSLQKLLKEQSDLPG